MSLCICILGSGSSGNCTYVASRDTAVLIDAGMNARKVEQRLEAIQVDPATIRGICVTHEHADHTAGLRVLQKRYGMPVYVNGGTMDALMRSEDLKSLQCKQFITGSCFELGNLKIEAFSVPHDAYDPVGFVITCGDARVGVVMDMGIPTSLVRERLRNCHAVVVEANHDEEMLMAAQRPWYLKQRIMGRQGHLSNSRAAEMLADIASPRLAQVFLAHLSEECNRPDLARQTAHDMLLKHGHGHVRVSLSYPDRVSEVWTYDPALAAVAT